MLYFFVGQKDLVMQSLRKGDDSILQGMNLTDHLATLVLNIKILLVKYIPGK